MSTHITARQNWVIKARDTFVYDIQGHPYSEPKVFTSNLPEYTRRFTSKEHAESWLTDKFKPFNRNPNFEIVELPLDYTEDW